MTDVVAIDLPLEPESAPRAREELEPFRGALDETSFFDLRLLVTELVIEALNAASKAQGSSRSAWNSVTIEFTPRCPTAAMPIGSPPGTRSPGSPAGPFTWCAD